MAGGDQVIRQLSQHLSLTILIDQCHHAFFDIHRLELSVADLDFGIDQRRADGVSRVGFHRACPVCYWSAA